ncbi:putative peptidoglycan glycosyltransferase FtsW [Labrys sp. ZIDIC5]|uniref:FtsW/RodA/SpoVE family cell cycle protein n=1 Tax=Labrys sedimenti TaxID=3106036 RepID=UPI002ACA7DF7|nr:putative peptidoglycan glycosyltransferase FtsW [Labrys sp. ZIDIC5]MDZ5451856.1 putative peptidoglycan glycosyltransferase FtsW [Labrys sp. ZIDIC5]
MASRTERSAFNAWWWTVDRLMLMTILALMLTGIVLLLAASPAVAERIGISDMFHFVNRQAMMIPVALMVMIGISFLSPQSIRRLALVMFLVSIALVAATLLFGAEVKGSRRWIAGIQPSEFLKPAFVVLAAWLFSENVKRPDVPANILAMLLLACSAGLLILQPDFGQTMLISIVWGALFFMAGLHWFWMVGLGGVGVVGIVAAYQFIPHVTSRIDRFLKPEGTDTFQVDVARDAFLSGGWLGKGPGEGTYKLILPDSHTDFIMAVTGEEFGLLFVMVVVAMFALIVLRGFWHAYKVEDPFCRFATAGLTLLFGMQSSINLMVNLHMMPAKGMTLPFISYGGSSLISVAYGMGMVLALTRRRPRTDMLESAFSFRDRRAQGTAGIGLSS